jgi:TolB-like protein
MKRAISWLLLYCFSLYILTGNHFIIYAQEHKKPAIAVLTIESKGGISKSEAATLSDRLGSMLVNTNAFIVLERGKMNEILSEQGFQQTGCTSTQCAVEVGKLLNVQKMVSGSIGKIGQTYTIDLSLIDVKTAQIEQSFVRDYKGEIDGLLREMEAIAGQIAAKSSGKPLEEQKYVVSIRSTPTSGTIVINNKEIGNTPYRFTAPKGMELSIKIKKENYQDWEQRITVKDNMEINASLQYAIKGKEGQKQVVKEGGSKTWLWITLGVLAVGGGVAAAVLGGAKDEEEQPAAQNLPDPSWPPASQ